MHPVIDELVTLSERDPFPAGHTSSYWQRYGHQIVVERTADGLAVRASSLETVEPVGLASRLLCGLERWSYRSVTAQLHSYPDMWRVAKRLAWQLAGGPHLTFQVFKSACALSVLADHATTWRLEPQTCLLIGDGCGFLGALLRRRWAGVRLYCVDLPRSLVLQARTHLGADHSVAMAVLGSKPPQTPATVNFVLPQHLDEIPEAIDWAIAIASMQEMNPESIAGYFEFLRRRIHPTSRFYCVSRLQKALPGGEVVAFHDYPWREDDEIFLDGPCPYYTHFLSPHTAPKGPRVAGVRVPFVNRFDGAHMHRLVRLAPSNGEAA